MAQLPNPKPGTQRAVLVKEIQNDYEPSFRGEDGQYYRLISHADLTRGELIVVEFKRVCQCRCDFGYWSVVEEE